MDLKPGDTERAQEDTEERQRGASMPSSGFSFTGSSQRHEPDLCEEHEEKLKLYCEDDQLAICLVCGMSRGHKTHNVIPINEAFENYKVTLLQHYFTIYVSTYVGVWNTYKLAGFVHHDTGT